MLLQHMSMRILSLLLRVITTRLTMSRTLLLLTFLLATPSFSAKKKRELKKEKKLLRLVEAEIRSIKKVKSKKDQLAYRLFELYSERVKLHRKLEEEKVVKGKANKKTGYTVSTRYYRQAQQFGKTFLKQYPRSRLISNTYMTLAINVLEIENDPKGDKEELIAYLTKAIKTARRKNMKHAAQTKLAELYYILEDFKTAVKYYEIVTRVTNDPWYTKNLLNLSWCYFQEKRYEDAIDSVMTAHRKSTQRGFTDVRDQVADAVNYFYVFNKEPEKAINYHIQFTKKELDQRFIHLLNLALNHISSNVALRAEVKARRYCSLKKDYGCLYLMSQFKLNIYKDIKDYNSHYRSVVSLVKEYKMLKKKQRKNYSDVTNEAINNIAELSSYIQSLAYKDHYILNGDKETTYNRLVNNYNQLKVLNKYFTYEYAFLQGELSYKEKYYDNSSEFYLESLEATAKKKRDKFYPKLFKSMFSLANEKSYDNKKYFEKAYMSYIKWKPKDPETSKQYDKLFKFYMTEKNMEKIVKLVDFYHKNIPGKIKDQKEMIKTVLNHYIKIKDTNALATWVQKLQKGYLKFTKAFVEKNITILAQLLFQRTKRFEESGKTKLAIKEYEKIYSNKIYPLRIKNDSAFNISVIYLKFGKVQESYNWMERVLKKHEPKNLIPKVDVILTTAQQYYLLQSPERSHDLYKFVTENYCDKSKTYPQHYTQIQELNLALRKYKTFNLTQKMSTRCRVNQKLVTISKGSYVDLLVQEGSIKILNKYIKNKPAYKEYQSLVFSDLLNRFWQEDFEHGNLKGNKNYENLQSYTAGNQFLTSSNWASMRLLNTFVNYYHNTMATDTRLKSMKKFDVNQFNNDFNNSLSKLTLLKENGMALANNAQDPNIYSATLATIYHKFAQFQENILNYKVRSKDKILIKEVKKNFRMITGMLSQQMSQIQVSYKNSDRNNVVNNQFAKYFNYDKEMGKVSLYKNKEVNLLNINKGM